jgi:hypothetical protein
MKSADGFVYSAAVYELSRTKLVYTKFFPVWLQLVFTSTQALTQMFCRGSFLSPLTPLAISNFVVDTRQIFI